MNLNKMIITSSFARFALLSDAICLLVASDSEKLCNHKVKQFKFLFVIQFLLSISML